MVGRSPKPSDIDDLPTVKRWLGQLEESKVTHEVGHYIGTKGAYRLGLIKFNDWLTGRELDMRVQAVRNEKIVRENVRMSFAHVEELLNFGVNENATDVRQIVSMFLRDPCNANFSQGTMGVIGSAVKSYFSEHDVEFAIKFNKLGKAITEVTEKPGMTLYEFYKMLTVGRTTPVMRAMLLVKLHAALDAATLADRFNYYAYKQIAEFCGTKNHREWDLDKCPIPIKLVRVKTSYEHTTFIDRDALEAVKDYLAWKEEKHSSHDPDGPMFFNNSNKPINRGNVDSAFSKLAEEAGVQKKLAPKVLKITPHEVRDLMKSTLLMCGCAAWAADHVLGHTPKDSYDKPAEIYANELRKEYSKVSHVLNMFSYVKERLKNIENPDALRGREKNLKEVIKKLEEREMNTMKRLKDSNGGVRELSKTNRKLEIENEKLEMRILELQREILEIKKQLSAVDGQPDNAEGVIKKIAERVGEAIEDAVEKAFEKRSGGNPQAESPSQ